MRLLNFLGAYLVLAAIFAAGMYQLTGLRSYLALVAHGIETRGIVVGTACANHDRYRYTFQAQGRWFSGSASGGIAKDCSELRSGEEIGVTYLSTDPSVNTAGDVRQRRNNEILSSLLVVLLFPAAIVLRFGLRSHPRRSRT
ncbi:hypothetical protein [Nevskia soli]|uniref:hypothetical protein n=1 Tax=Nevskia soli TaxID=418856 RepID=UPI0004A73348|nr:hypothetical protein [Nevskia soli]